MHLIGSLAFATDGWNGEMQCAECKFLDLSTPINRRWAAVGYAVCSLHRTPADNGDKTLQNYPVFIEHKCPACDELKGDERLGQLKKLKSYREYLEHICGKS